MQASERAESSESTNLEKPPNEFKKLKGLRTLILMLPAQGCYRHGGSLWPAHSSPYY